MVPEKKKMEISEKSLFSVFYSAIIGYALIVFMHLFQTKWNFYHPLADDSNYWYIKCPFDHNIEHKGSTEFSGAIFSPFSHFILWLFLIIILTITFRFFQTTKIKIK